MKTINGPVDMKSFNRRRISNKFKDSEYTY